MGLRGGFYWEEVVTSLETVLIGTLANRWSRTWDTTMPPWEWPIRTTLSTVGSDKQALT